MKSKLNLLKESGAGKLYEANGFLVPVLTGSSKEMGAQYGALMVEHMQKAYDVLIEPGRQKGRITDADARAWTERVYSTGSMRYRLFYDGLAEATGWPLDTDGSYKYATMGWPGILFPLTAMNEHGAYMDLHDGTSMGSSIVCYDRIPSTSLLSDLMAESPSLSAMVHRLNTYSMSTAMILTLADESSGASMECSSLAGSRVRKPVGESMVVVDTFLDDSWSIGKRDSVTHSFSARLPNMTRHLAANKGKVDAKLTRDLMDIKLYAADGKLAVNGRCTKPTNQDEDITVHQVVTDVKRRETWLKRPNPDVFADWTHFDLKVLWG